MTTNLKITSFMEKIGLKKLKMNHLKIVLIIL